MNDPNLKSNCSKCSACEILSWPTAAQLGLEKSQYEAVKLAMSNKLALIQGFGIFLKINQIKFNNTL